MERLLIHSIFNNNKSTFQACSLDDSNGTAMICSEYEVIDFDKVKDEYIREKCDINLAEFPMSNDCLAVINDDIFFVEFKNGSINSVDAYKLHIKVYDSLLLYSDITEETLTDIRKNVGYILVYNEEKNRELQPFEEGKKIRLRAAEVPGSGEYNSIVQSVMGFAQKQLVRFGLNFFNGYCFREMHTLNEEQFKRFLSCAGIS